MGLVTAVGITFLVAASPIAAAELPPDWKVYGEATLSSPATRVLQFYQESSLRWTWQSDGSVRTVEVWSKDLSRKAVKAKYDALPRSLLQRTAKLLLRGYVPPALAMMKLDQGQLIDSIAEEEIADEQNISPDVQMLVEFDCPNKMMRELSLVLRHGNVFGSLDEKGQWKHVPPESSSEELIRMFCTRRV